MREVDRRLPGPKSLRNFRFDLVLCYAMARNLSRARAYEPTRVHASVVPEPRTLIEVFMSSTIPRDRFIVAATLAIAMLFATVQPSSAFLDKTRFAAHLGVAYFAFHHFVLKPYQEHRFDNGADHRTVNIIKGGAAMLFAVHELKVAEKISHNSNSKILHALDGKLVALGATFATVGSALHSGKFEPKAVDSVQSSTDDFGKDSAAAGEPIKDVPVAIPG